MVAGLSPPLGQPSALQWSSIFGGRIIRNVGGVETNPGADFPLVFGHFGSKLILGPAFITSVTRVARVSEMNNSYPLTSKRHKLQLFAPLPR